MKFLSFEAMIPGLKSSTAYPTACRAGDFHLCCCFFLPDKPVKKGQIAESAKYASYCNDCMFCFQPNELRWCLPQ